MQSIPCPTASHQRPVSALDAALTNTAVYREYLAREAAAVESNGTSEVTLEDRPECDTRPYRPSRHEPLAGDEEKLTGVEHAATNDTEPEPEAKAPVTRYACPDVLWQGIFQQVAEKLSLRTWEVWFGTFGTLCARAHRNLHCHYYSDHLYGNTFSLLVSPTGAGKNIVVNIVRSMLGEEYKIRTGLNSGQALVPMLTDDSLQSKNGRLTVRGVPLVLLASEWSRIAQMSGIEHATLQEDLNDLFMRHYPWSQSRSHKNPSGGDIVIENPALTIVGTTTRKLSYTVLTDKALGSGTINRYLILPGSATFQAYTGKSYRADESITGLIDHLKTHTFGLGREISSLYSTKAWEAFLNFQDTFILPIQNDPETSEALKRLHFHLQHVAALYAWQMKSACIELEHIEAAIALIRVSHAFVTELIEERAKEFAPTKVQEVEAAMEKRVIARLKQYPGLTRREFARKIAQNRGGYGAWGKTVEALVKVGAITTKKKGKREELYVLPGF